MRPPKSRKIRALTTFIPHQTPFCLLGIIFLYSLLIGLSTQSLWCYRHNELHSMAISDCTQPTNAFESETLRISVESAFPFPPKAFDDDLVKKCHAPPTFHAIQNHKEIRQIELSSVTSTHGLVLVGIFCRAEDVQQRNLLRTTSHHLAPPGVSLRFVVCHAGSLTERSVLAAESMLHGDLMLLDCEESMDAGKSPLFFKTVLQIYPSYHYYAKMDIDTYCLYFNLALALDHAPKCGLYMGQYYHYITEYNVGQLYVLSKDLVEVIRDCRHDCPDPHNFEDMVIGLYLNRFAKDRIQWGSWGPRHVVNKADGTMLGDPDPGGGAPLRELFTPWVILVHKVKREYWMDATRYFRNVLSVETVRASAGENFVDGPTTDYWNVDCSGSMTT